MYLVKVPAISDELYEAVCKLVPQLGAHKPIPTRAELESLVDSESSDLWIARYPDRSGVIAGMLTISMYRVPTGLRSIVEDVVVDQALRRRGIAEALLQAAIESARAAGANSVMLTSNPQREAANLLYRSIGFEQRVTNSYFYPLK
ncbi:MAG TPA: GNAT family N-acetyltransferase [Anaerolineales bacterium]|nr:GNAT family N-acetyltransferase [Anaerolineales bacterium]